VSVHEESRQGTASGPAVPGSGAGAAADVLAIIETALGVRLPIKIRCWDGSEAGNPDADATLVLVNSRALSRLLWAPNELGLVRAYVSGDLDFEGDIYSVLDMQDVIKRIAYHEKVGLTTGQRLRALATVAKLGALGMPPAPPPEELRPRRGPIHTKSRDAASISHHYDVGNDFYRLILGPSMVYSCAYWTEQPSETYRLENAQHDKCELICTKLSLRPGMRMLDVGCGWGSLAIHAASKHGVSVVGVTLSQEQAAFARARVEAEGLSDRVEIRIQDYRDVVDGPYDVISSVGMSEHVGLAKMTAYTQTLMNLLPPGGRLLNHAIASVRTLPAPSRRDSGFIQRYIFPDGEVPPLSTTLDALEKVGFEVRDSQALREHYGLTLRAWVDNLRDAWPQAVEMVGEARARTWLLYLAACALAFEHGNITIHQVVAVRQGERAASGLPLTRTEWLNG